MAILAAVVVGLVALAGIGWGVGALLERLAGVEPTPLTETQLEALVLTQDDLGDGWWELPPADPFVIEAQEAALMELLGDERCGAIHRGPDLVSADETTYASSLSSEACGTRAAQIRYAQQHEEQFIEFHHQGVERVAAMVGGEVVEMDGAAIDHDLGDDVYALGIQATFLFEGERVGLHFVELSVYADHGYVSVALEQWHRPVPRSLQRHAVDTVRARLDALGAELAG